MTKNRLLKAFLLAVPIALGNTGCAVYNRVDTDTCNTWKESKIGIPQIFEIFRGKHSAISNDLCTAGMKIGYSAMMGRQGNGELHPMSIIMWQKQYQDLMDKIRVLPPTQADELFQVKQFADFFIREASEKYGNSLVTSEMAQAMYESKVTDPTLFTPDGKFAPPTAAQKKETACKGTGMFRDCTAKPAEPAVQ